MRSSAIPLLLLASFGCVQVNSPEQLAPLRGNQPPLPDGPLLAVLPGDLVSWLQTDPPEIFVALLGSDLGGSAELLQSLAGTAQIFDPSGKSIAVSTRLTGLPLQRVGITEAFEPPGFLVTPKAKLGPGWYRLTVDVAKQPSVRTSVDAYTATGRWGARFNVASAPTVRRVQVCPSLQQLHVRFSEQVKATTSLAKALVVRDTAGGDLHCNQGALYEDGELVSVKCTSPIPSVIRVEIAPGGFVSQISAAAVQSLAGKPFAATLTLSELPSDGNSQGECPVYVPK